MQYSAVNKAKKDLKSALSPLTARLNMGILTVKVRDTYGILTVCFRILLKTLSS